MSKTDNNNSCECQLTTCLKKYGSRGTKKYQLSERLCKLVGHLFCKCEDCINHPVCLRCKLSIKTGNYL